MSKLRTIRCGYCKAVLWRGRGKERQCDCLGSVASRIEVLASTLAHMGAEARDLGTSLARCEETVRALAEVVRRRERKKRR